MKATVTKEEFEALSDELKNEYAAKSGDGYDYVAKIEESGGFSLGQIGGMRSALENEKAQLADARKKLKKFERDGKLIDADAAREALAKLEELGDVDPDAKAKYEAREKQLIEKHNAAVKERDERDARAKSRIHKLLITDKARAALAKKAPKNVELLLPHVERFMKVEERDDDFIPVVLGEDLKTPRITRDAKKGTEAMDTDELVEWMSQDPRWSGAFPAITNNGTGDDSEGKGGGGKGGTIKFGDTDALSSNLEAVAKGSVRVTD